MHFVPPPPNSADDATGSKSWRNRLSAFKNVPTLIKLVWNAHPTYLIAIVCLRLIRSFVPITTLWVGKLIIDLIVLLREGKGSYHLLWKLIFLEVVIVLTGDLLARASSLIESWFGDLFNIHISDRLMVHAA